MEPSYISQPINHRDATSPSPFGELNETLGGVSELHSRIMVLRDRLIGPQAEKAGSPNPAHPSAGVFGAVSDASRATRELLVSMIDALSQIERQLP